LNQAGYFGHAAFFSFSFWRNTDIVYVILSGCPAGVVAGNVPGTGIFSSRKDAEMLKLVDSGCAQHPARPITLSGQAAALVGRLILKLSPTEAGYTYICEHGYTHCLTLQPCEVSLTSTPPRFGFKGNSALNH
jgi:hypothetical protein